MPPLPVPAKPVYNPFEDLLEENKEEDFDEFQDAQPISNVV